MVMMLLKVMLAIQSGISEDGMFIAMVPIVIPFGMRLRPEGRGLTVEGESWIAISQY